MPSEGQGLSRRRFVKRATAASVAAFSARGIYDLIDGMVGNRPNRAYAAATVRRREEQYLVDSVEVILDSGVTLAIPPLHNDVFTAKLASNRTWTTSALKAAQTRLENALATVERPYTSTAAGLTMVIGWGLPYFRTFVPMLTNTYLPAIPNTNPKQYAVEDAIAFPSDPSDVMLEDNHVMFKIRSDSSDIVKSVEAALFDNPNSGAYIGDLFDLTSKRIGFLGRGFGYTDKQTPGPSIAKALAVAAGAPGANSIPDRTQLMMGFTSTQTQALGPDNIPSFETLPGVTDQWPNGYFAAGCAMHLSHLDLDIDLWYNSSLTNPYGERVKRMFSPRTGVPSNSTPVTIPNGQSQVSTMADVMSDASNPGILGHNALLQQATRLGRDVTDNYGRLRSKGTAVPLREDFNTLDNPFSWAPGGVGPTNSPGLHFVAFVPGHYLFHRARRAMDGVMPDGTTNFRTGGQTSDGHTYPAISDENMGINARMRASHRQNYVIPPRRHRSFPMVELLK
jgi:hypothetical protein